LGGIIIRLLEYESKELFKQFGIPLAASIVILKGENINEKIGSFKFPAIVKSQIAIGSRKKAGLIKVAQSKEEATSLCTQFFEKTVGDFSVQAILIEELVSIQHEYYYSIALDESGRQFYAIASKEGGIDIEEVSATNPEAIIKIPFSLRGGLSDEMAKTIAKKLDFSNEELEAAVDLWKKLWKITHELEAQLVEINPLVMSFEGLVAVDGKMILDDDAAFRQPVVERLLKKKSSSLEKIAEEAGFSFVELEGDVGILANGAGLTMALIDVLSNIGLKPANFLDVGGGANKERVYKALELLIKINPKVILVNIFGGITRCDIVAEAIIQALQDFQNPPPIVIRLTGTMDREGIKILNEHNVNAFTDVMEAVKKVKEVLR
jgi:succinyl-CoA synthetase beta subunit